MDEMNMNVNEVNNVTDQVTDIATQVADVSTSDNVSFGKIALGGLAIIAAAAGAFVVKNRKKIEKKRMMKALEKASNLGYTIIEPEKETELNEHDAESEKKASNKK